MTKESLMPDVESSLAIILVNWNGYKDSSNCLKSLRDIQYANYSIILVDNGSKDHSGDRLKQEFPEIILIKNEENLGFTGGNNKGLEYALAKGFELLLLLNNDTIVSPNFANILSQGINGDGVGAIQPKIMYNQQREVIWNAGSRFSAIFSFPMTIGFNKKDRGQFDHKKEIPWITGCCFLVKSSVIREIGLLDDQFFAYYEDVDWSLRIRKAGYRLIFEPEAKIYHEVGRSDQQRSSEGEGNLSPFAHYITVRNGVYLMRKHTNALKKISGVFYQIVKFSGYFTYFTLRGRSKKRRAVIKGFKEGLFMPLKSDFQKE